MRVLVIGGSASGKSEYAEQLAMSLGEKRVYLATMVASDPESQERIERHRAMRAGKGFTTVERSRNFAGLELSGGVVLLECLTNLVAGEMFSPGGAGKKTAAVVEEGILHLVAQVDHLIVVTGDLFRDGGEYDGGTRAYLEALGELNRRLAASFDRVVEVVCGIPIPRKGERYVGD